MMGSYTNPLAAGMSGSAAPSTSNAYPNSHYEAPPQYSAQPFRIKRVFAAKQLEPSPELLDQLYGIKRVYPANHTASQPAKKRKVKKEVDYDEDDEIAFAKARLGTGGKHDFNEQGT